MNLFLNISHPAHVHFFKNAIEILSRRGHNIIVAARNKEFTIELLNAYQIRHVILTNKGSGLVGLIRELLEQQLKISQIIRKNSIDMMLQIGGIFNAPIGKYYRIPTLAFSDTENDKWGNKLSFFLSKHVLIPSCFDHQSGGFWQNQVHYPGYHELAYLSPRYAPKMNGKSKNILLRFVGWAAGHDIGEKGLTDKRKIELVQTLKNFGSIFISSEAPLPDEISRYACTIHPSEIHVFLSKCKLVVGESATMASEAACLGIPAIFISNTGRGYTTEQDEKYGLIKHYRLNQWDELIYKIKQWAGQNLFDKYQTNRWTMLKDKIDVTAWLVDLIEGYPGSIEDTKKGYFERYCIACAE